MCAVGHKRPSCQWSSQATATKESQHHAQIVFFLLIINMGTQGLLTQLVTLYLEEGTLGRHLLTWKFPALRRLGSYLLFTWRNT